MSYQKKQVEDELPTEQIRNGKLSGVRIWHQAQSVMICDCRLRGGAEVVVGHSITETRWSRSLVSLSLAWFLFNIKDSDIFDLDSLGKESPPNKTGNALDDDGEDSRESDFVSLRHHLGETIQNNPSS